MMWITAKKNGMLMYVDVRYSPIPEKDGDWDWERWGLSDVKQQTGEQLMQIEAFHRELYKLPVITIWWCGSAPWNHEWIKPEPTARGEKKTGFSAPKPNCSSPSWLKPRLAIGFMVDISAVRWLYKPTYNLGAPPCMNCSLGVLLKLWSNMIQLVGKEWRS